MSRFAVGSVALCLAGLFTVAFSPAVHAEEPDSEVLQVKDVVVSSTRLPGEAVDARTLPAKVTIITADDIRKSGAKTVQEAIQWATGIVMYDQVGNNFQQTIDLRGFNGQPVPQTSVFVDGMRMNEPDFNTVNFDLIPYETIDRIEILPGPSAIYGKNAMGGVINIITKRGTDRHQATGETMFGSFQRERYTVNASGPLGKFDYYTNFSRETESGYRDDSGARISRVYGRIGYRPTSDTDLTLSYTYVKDHLLAAGTLPLSLAAINRRANFTPGDFTDNENNVVRFTGRQNLPLGFSLNGNAFYRHLGQQLFTVGQSSIANNLVKTESEGGVLQLMHAADPFDHHNSLVIGSEYTHNKFGSNSLSSFSGFGSFPALISMNEKILAFYAQDTLSLTSRLILTAGVRYDRDQIDFSDDLVTPNSGSKAFYRTNPRAGLTYMLSPQASLYMNYSQGFRVPTFQELFALGPFGSNPNLRPVQSKNYEIGLKSQIGSWGEANFAVFQSDVKDDILFVCGDPNCGGQASNLNVDRTRRRGIETTLKGRYNQHFDGIINYTFTEATFRTDLALNPYFVGFTPFIEHVQTGDTLPMVPKHRLSVTGNYHPTPEWTLSLIGLYVSTQFYLNDEENAQPRNPGYFVLNSRLSYETVVPGGRLTGFLMLNNILDQKYSTFGIIAPNTVTGGGAPERFIMPAPGIAIYGGLSYRFEKS